MIDIRCEMLGDQRWVNSGERKESTITETGSSSLILFFYIRAIISCSPLCKMIAITMGARIDSFLGGLPLSALNSLSKNVSSSLIIPLKTEHNILGFHICGKNNFPSCPALFCHGFKSPVS